MSGAEAVVGVVASGAGLASLAIQLLESVNKLKNFYSDVKDAPKTLEEIISSLEEIETIIEWLESHRERNEEPLDIIEKPVLRCCNRIKELESMVRPMELRIERSVKSKIKFAFRKKETAGIQAKLGRALQVLSFAVMVYQRYQSQRDQDRISQEGRAWKDTLIERIRHEFQLFSTDNAHQTAQLITSIIAPRCES